MHNILITGVNGFLGNYLVRLLLSKKHHVLGVGKGSSRVDVNQAGFNYLELDFTRQGDVTQVIDHYRPSVIIHAGAMTKPDECELNRQAAYVTNVQGTINLLAAASVHNAHFIQVSTDFVFRGNKEVYTEDDPGDPVNYYGETKLLAEEAVKQYKGKWSMVRTILVYGQPKAGRQNILTNVAEALKNGKVLNMYCDQTRTPTYVEDLAAGIASVAAKQATGIFHLSGEEQFTPYDLAIRVADHLNLNKSLINSVTSDTFKQPALRPPRTIFDLTKAKKELGYQVTPFSEGLKRTFAD
jgi:dTDP-4-dehydrorhamnose reductase